MKKLLLLLVLFVSLFSCTYQEVSDDTTVSNEAISLLKTTDANSFYVIKTKDYHYYFDSNKVLIEKYKTDAEDINIPMAVFIIFLVFALFLGLFIGILTSD